MLTKTREAFSRISFAKIALTLVSFVVLGFIVAPAANATSDSVWNAIVQCESGGNPHAQNRYSTASGLFQDLDSTWNHYGGYSRAMYAPVSVQWQFNTRLSLSNWDASRSCWQSKIGSAPAVNRSGLVALAPPKVIHSKPILKPKPVIKYHPATPTPVTVPAQLSSATGYTVVLGDTLSGIAVRFNIKGGWPVVAANNRGIIPNPDLIFPGQYLSL